MSGQQKQNNLHQQFKACDNIRNRSFKDDVERIAWKKIKQREQSR